MLCRGISGLTRSAVSSVPKVGTIPLNGSAFVPLRASTTSHKHNKTHRQAATKHHKRRMRAVAREGSTRFDLYDRVTLDDFHRWPRPLVLESDTIPGYIRPAAQLVTKKPYASLDVIPF